MTSKTKLCRLVPSIFMLLTIFYLMNLESQPRLKTNWIQKFTNDSIDNFDFEGINGNNNGTVITLRDKNGSLILHRSLDRLTEPLRKWKPRKESLAFIHIGKSGGTSFDKALNNSVLKKNQCKLKCSRNLQNLKKRQDNCPEIKSIFCGKHFDWTPIDATEKKGHNVAPVVLIRHPIERVVSHFYYARTISWTGNKKIRSQTLTEYLNDVESMIDTHIIWYDGQVCLSVAVLFFCFIFLEQTLSLLFYILYACVLHKTFIKGHIFFLFSWSFFPERSNTETVL